MRVTIDTANLERHRAFLLSQAGRSSDEAEQVAFKSAAGALATVIAEVSELLNRRWIACSSELPVPLFQYIAWDDQDERAFVAFFDGDTWFDEEMRPMPYVTHWHPMPDATTSPPVEG